MQACLPVSGMSAPAIQLGGALATNSSNKAISMIGSGFIGFLGFLDVDGV